MAVGKINTPQDFITDLSTNYLICAFICTYGGDTRGNVWHWMQSDYVSYDSSTYKFTCKRAFTAQLQILAKGSRNAGGTDYSISWNFRKNSTSVVSGTSSNASSNLPSAQSVTFAKNDTFYISGSHGTNVYLGQMGFFLRVASA